MALFLALMLNVSVAYPTRQDSLNHDPQNRRVTDARFAQNRGPILVGKAPVAQSDAIKDRFKYQRRYADGPLYAPVTGYYSYYFGTSGLEASYSAQLSGTADSQLVNRLVNSASGKVPQGGTVETTIQARAQRAAWQALGGRKGAVVALDSSTGAVLALVSSPSYDPNDLASHDLPATQAAWTKLGADTARPLANRATKEIYAPGSTFKLITAAAALENGWGADDSLDATTYRLPGSTRVITGNCGGSNLSLADALAVSCNPLFARLGVELGQDQLRQQAERFGFGTRLLADIGSSASVFPEELDKAQTGMSAIGAFEVQASPLQMALVAAAVDNSGVAMEPYIVQRVLNADLSVVSEAHPQQLSQAVSDATAAELKQMMLGVVQHGTGTQAAVAGLSVGGKTGTAVTSDDRRPYAWFVAFADELDVAVCVFIEDAEIPATDIAGGTVAAPVARAVIEALK
jgi:peptidoglycan glycosyltransferase